MRTYVVRFNHPIHGTVTAEVVAATEADARGDIERRYPSCDILSSHIKPRKLILPEGR